MKYPESKSEQQAENRSETARRIEGLLAEGNEEQYVQVATHIQTLENNLKQMCENDFADYQIPNAYKYVIEYQNLICSGVPEGAPTGIPEVIHSAVLYQIDAFLDEHNV